MRNWILRTAGAIGVAWAGSGALALTVDDPVIEGGTIGSFCNLYTTNFTSSSGGNQASIGLYGGREYYLPLIDVREAQSVVSVDVSVINDNCLTSFADDDVQLLRPGATYSTSGPFGIRFQTGDEEYTTGAVGEVSFESSPDDVIPYIDSAPTPTFLQSGVNAANATAVGFEIADAEFVARYTYTITSSGGGKEVAGDGTVASASGSVTVSPIDVSSLPDGTLTLTVMMFASDEILFASDTDTVTKDVDAPSAPSVPLLANGSNSGSTSDTLTNDTTPTITGTAEANATVEVFVGSTSAGTTTAGGSGAWSFTFTDGALASGANAITATARDAAGNVSPASSELTITLDAGAPTVTITGPTDVVTEDFTVTFTFSEGVTGFATNDVTVTNGSKGAFAEPTSGSVYTLVITPELGTTVSISVAADTAEDAAGNGNEASNTFEVSAGSPASAFEEHREEIRQVIVDDAARSLSSSLSVNRRMTQEARDRFIEGRRQMAGEASGLVSRNNVPFDVDGSFELSGSTLSTRGSFFEQTGNYEGIERRLLFGDFDIQHDADTGNTTATLTARVAWEHLITDTTIIGSFVGGELAYSNLKGTFTGDQERVGAIVGAYAVHALDEQLFLDGFLTLGAGRNNLEMANDVLAVTSDYTTHTATAGAALSGVYEYDQYEFRPELAFSYGKTWIGDVDFTGRAYGLVDNTLSLDAGSVSIANLTLRPEVIWALASDTVAESNSHVSFAPRLICESHETVERTKDCGGGAEFGLSSQSSDGLSRAEFRVIMDRVGDTTRSSFAFNLEHQF